MFTYLTEKSLKAFLQLLSNFDYFHAYSDDISVYRAGQRQEQQIKDICKNKDFMDVWTAWQLHTENEKTKTPDSGKLFNDTLAVILSRATVPPLKETPVVSTTVASAPVTPMPRFATITTAKADEKPFTSAREFLQDSTAAKLYLAKRVVDAVKLTEEIKWQRADLQGVVVWPVYGVRVYKDVVFSNPAFNTIESETSKLNYLDDCCMLAYMLAKFW